MCITTRCSGFSCCLLLQCGAKVLEYERIFFLYVAFAFSREFCDRGKHGSFMGAYALGVYRTHVKLIERKYARAAPIWQHTPGTYTHLMPCRLRAKLLSSAYLPLSTWSVLSPHFVIIFPLRLIPVSHSFFTTGDYTTEPPPFGRQLSCLPRRQETS